MEKIILAAVNATFNHTNPAIRYIRKYCMESEFIQEHCKILCREYTINDPVRETVADLLQEDAQIYAFSCYIWNIDVILEIAEMTKKIKPECSILLGGPEVSYEDESFFSLHPFVDCIIRGPGEKAFSDLVRQVIEKKAVPENDGSSLTGRIFQKKLVDGQSIALTAVLFPYEDGDFQVRQKQYYYETTRGCPFSCSYCLSSVTGPMDILPVERVKREMRYFIGQKISQVKLVDRTFNFNDDRAVEIWQFLMQEYEKQPFETNFHFEIAADLLSDKALELLKLAPKGLFQFEIGVQTTNASVLDHIRRKSDLPKINDRVRRLKESGNISLHLDLIAGLPGEDMTSFARSFCDVYSMKPNLFQLGFLKVLKGSPIRREAAESKIIYPDKAPYEVLASDSMTFFELLRLKKIEELLERYYNSGHFTHSLEFIIGFAENPFDFFNRFENFWEEKGYFSRKMSRQDVIRAVYFFGNILIASSHGLSESQHGEADHLTAQYRDLLKFDYYRLDKKGSLDELNMNFSHHHPILPREQEKESWYHANGKPVCTKPRLEHYSFDVPRLLESNRCESGSSFVLYELNGDKPVIYDVLCKFAQNE